MAEKIAAANAIFDDSELKRIIREKYSHGHPAFNDMAIAMMQLHSEKNKAYAGGGTPLGNFDRNANILRNYPTFPYDTPAGFLMNLVLKHFDAIMWALNNRRRPPEDACADISVYMTILRCMQYPEQLHVQDSLG